MTKPKTMQEAARAIRERLTSLVKKEAEGIKDPEARRLFKASMLGSAHIEPGVHEPAEAGVAEHLEPGNHEQVAPSEEQPPADEAQPVQGGLGVPGGQLQDDGIVGSPENGTVDLCPLCHQEDVPGKCTCLDAMAKNEVMGYGGGPGQVGGQPMMMSEPCKKCAGMHRPMEKCGEQLPVKKAQPPLDEKANGNKPNAGQTVDSRAGLSSMATTNARAGGARPQLSKAFDDKGTVPGSKEKALPKDSAPKAIKSPGSGGKPKEGSLNKTAVPAAKPPSGKVPGGTGAPPMASNNSAPKIGAPAPKPPAAVPGAPKPLGKVAPPPGVKQQMQQHMLHDASKAAQKAPAAAPQAAKPTLTNPNDMSRANDLASQVGGGASFQPQPVKAPPKPAGIAAPGRAAPAPKRSLFSALFGPKR